MNDVDVVVVGAGAVGASAALWLQRRGHSVVLADPSPPGSGASSGNACTLATYACIPVNTPGVLWNLPGLLMSRNSPLALSLSYALANPRWMSGFLANCRASRSRAIAQQLAMLLSHADAGLNPLIEDAGAEDLIVDRGQITVWSTNGAARRDEANLALRQVLGVSFETLTGDEVAAFEPELDLQVVKGVFFPGARHIRDTQALTARFVTRFEALGGRLVADRVTSVSADGDGVELRLSTDVLRANRVVIAAGAFSGDIAGSGVQSLPLGVERGYHVRFAREGHRITRPVGWSEGGFYAVPTAQGLRFAGTVELAPRDAPPNKKRLAYIARRSQQMFKGLPEPTGTWLGHRPTMPDSLPVIGHSPKSDRIIHAFGHQHLGLTLAGITGRIVADLAEGRTPNVPVDAFRPDRRFY